MGRLDRLKSFWDELKKRNVFRMVTFYAISSWIIIQFAVTVFPYLSLPDWITKAIVIFLVAAFPFIIIFSWVYEITKEGLKRTVEVPKTKSISNKTGRRLNRLIILVLSLAVLGFLVDEFFIEPRERQELELAQGSIAIFPFSIQGSESIQYLKEGMVDLISTKLDNIPGVHATDPNILLSTIHNINIDNRDPKSAGKVAEKLGANRFVLGSVTEVGNQLQVKLSKYDLRGSPVGKTIVETGEALVLYSKIDDIIRKLVAEELNEQGSDFNSEAVMSTESLESIIPYLKGEQLRREGLYQEAVKAYQESLEYDSSFMVCNFRLLELMGWMPNLYDWDQDRYPVYANVKKNLEQASGKNRDLMEAYIMFLEADPQTEKRYRELIAKYGESQALLTGLAETLFHWNETVGKSPLESRPLFERVLDYDPFNEEVKWHLIDLAIYDRDTLGLRKLLNSVSKSNENRASYEMMALLLKDSVSDDMISKVAKLPILNEQSIFLGPGGELRLKWFDLIERMQGQNEYLSSQAEELDRKRKAAGGQHEKFMEGYKEAYDLNGMSMMVFMAANKSIPLFNSREAELIDWYQEAERNNIYDSIFFTCDEGLLNIMLGDEEAFDQNLGLLRSLFDHRVSTLAKMNYYHLKGMKAFDNNDFQLATIFFDSAQRLDHNGVIDPWTIGGYAFVENVYLAEMRLDRGEYEEALQQFELTFNIRDSNPSGELYFWGLSMYRLGQIHQALGNEEEAITYYNMFTEVYQNCDEVYRPWVNDAEVQLALLVKSPERQLESSDQTL